MEAYEVVRDCWIKGRLCKVSQVVKLMPKEAKEFLDRKCLKVQTTKKKQETEGRRSEVK